MAETLTERQKAWLASVRAGLERETGRSLAEWVAIARTCPETKHRARLGWFKTVHRLGQNRASVILDEAFPEAMGWRQPDALEAALWRDPDAKAIFAAVRAVATTLEDVTIGQRKGYTAFSRTVQFAAARPRGGAVLLGLAIAPESDPRCGPPARPVWSDRLTAELTLDDPASAASIASLIEAAWARSR